MLLVKIAAVLWVLAELGNIGVFLAERAISKEIETAIQMKRNYKQKTEQLPLERIEQSNEQDGNKKGEHDDE